MKYYLIFKHTGNPRTKAIYPSYIVEHKNIAIDFCKEYHEFYYEERDDGSYITTTPAISSVADINPLSRGLENETKCPYCGARHFIIGGGMCTAMYCPTIMKDGKVISEDHNIYTQEYECLECHKRFKSVNGKVMKYEER